MFLVCFTCFLFVTIIIYHQDLFSFRVHTDIDKDADCFQNNNNNYLNGLWLLFAALFSFLKVLFNNRSNIKTSYHFNCFCAALFTQAY